MYLVSLDPRINRLGIPDEFGNTFMKNNLDQLETFEAFIQIKAGKAYEHAGIVHASTREMAFLFAKEQYSRRGGTCNGIWIIKTRHVKVSAFTEAGISIYEQITKDKEATGERIPYEIFHLYKRGKQHVHVGEVMAVNAEEAIIEAKKMYGSGSKPVLNVWVAKKDDIFSTKEEDNDIWSTLHEKGYRDAIAYKGLDKIKKFKEEQKTSK